MRDTLLLTLEYARGSDVLNYEDKRLLRFLARDPRTVLTAFDLDPSVDEYICCPSCFALFPNDASSPQTCTVSGEYVLDYLDIGGISYGKWGAILVCIIIIYRIA